MAGRPQLYDQVLLDLSLGKSITHVNRLPLTKNKIAIIRRRAKAIGVEIEVRTICKKKHIYRVS